MQFIYRRFFTVMMSLSFLLLFRGNVDAQQFDLGKKIVPNNPETLNYFGYAVSVSGDYAAISSVSADVGSEDHVFGSNSGAVFIYKNTGSSWVLLKKIVAPTFNPIDYFGLSVSLSGDNLVVGANAESYDNQNASYMENAGAVYIFSKNQGGQDNWGFIKKLLAPARQANAEFGYSVSVSGNSMIVGAVGESNYLGAAYIFGKDVGGTNTWGLARRITAPDAVTRDLFGRSVHINNDYAVVGAINQPVITNNSITKFGAGAAYIFKRNYGGQSNWGGVAKLTPSTRREGANFGASVAIEPGRVIVGAPLESEDDSYSNYGGAYIFQENINNNSWSEVTRLATTVPSLGSRFGSSVAIKGDLVLAGAPFDRLNMIDADVLPGAGSAFLFKKDQGGSNKWGRVQKFVSLPRRVDENFGGSVAFGDNVIFAGASGSDDSDAYTETHHGAAYIYKTEGSLPVTLKSFHAITLEKQVLISWETTEEVNADFFEVQKSKNGKDWMTVGTINAQLKGTGSASYDLYDKDPWSGQTLYRLKMVDTNKTYTYSKVQSVSLEEAGDNPGIYPNPTISKVTIPPALLRDARAIRLLHAGGKLAKSVSASETEIDITDLSSGIYMLEITKTKGEVKTYKVVVADK